MTHIHRLLIGAGLLAAVACSSETAPIVPPASHDVEGAWGDPSTGVIIPGNGFGMSLAESGGIVTGAGSFFGEAGPFGTLTVSGTVAANDSLHLVIVFNFNPIFANLKPDTARFDGILETRDTMQGVFSRDGQPSARTFVRSSAVIDPH